MVEIYFHQLIDSIWFCFFFLFFCYFLYSQAKRYFFESEISIQDGLDMMKGNIIALIVFYQGNYPEQDQIVLIKEWIDNLDKENIDKEQFGLFKEFVDEYYESLK